MDKLALFNKLQLKAQICRTRMIYKILLILLMLKIKICIDNKNLSLRFKDFIKGILKIKKYNKKIKLKYKLRIKYKKNRL